jgi:hypothetical protein
MNRSFIESWLWSFPPVGFRPLHFLSFTAALRLPFYVLHSTFHCAECMISMLCGLISHFPLPYRRKIRLLIKRFLAHCRSHVPRRQELESINRSQLLTESHFVRLVFEIICRNGLPKPVSPFNPAHMTFRHPIGRLSLHENQRATNGAPRASRRAE